MPRRPLTTMTCLHSEFWGFLIRGFSVPISLKLKLKSLDNFVLNISLEPNSESSDAGKNVVISWTSVSRLEEERKLIQSEATNNCVTLEGRWGDFVRISRTNFNSCHLLF